MRTKELLEVEEGQVMTILDQIDPKAVHVPVPQGIAVVVTAVPVQSLLL